MNKDLPPGALQKPTARVVTKAAQKAAQEANWRQVCKLVDARDGHRCRACGKRCNPNATDLLTHAHRHHLERRRNGKNDTTENVVTLCPFCHPEIKAYRLDIRATTPEGADGGLEFWRIDTEGTWYLARRERGVHDPEKD